MFLKRIMVTSNKKAERAVVQQKAITALTVTKACSFIGISRQAYYKQCTAQTQRNEFEQRVLDSVVAERIYQPRIGSYSTYCH